jgi:excisionase family DNA binding protein
MPKRKTPRPAPAEPAPQQEFMTVAEVAALLRCDPRSVLNRIHDGELDAVKDQRRWLILVASYYRYKSNLRNRRRK